jgi:hypothetical protein
MTQMRAEIEKAYTCMLQILGQVPFKVRNHSSSQFWVVLELELQYMVV